MIDVFIFTDVMITTRDNELVAFVVLGECPI